MIICTSSQYKLTIIILRIYKDIVGTQCKTLELISFFILLYLFHRFLDNIFFISLNIQVLKH